MLPTKGYFQDIECPFYNTTCGRPYCHFRHKRKLNENIEDNVQDTSKSVVPTYKPTPKSELANIHNSKSHIPISYVPDLSFKRERTIRPIRIDKPTYNPTPLSILSSANKPDSTLPVNEEHQETIKDIQENIASNIYDPLKSEINFEDLSNEFELIDDIINDSSEAVPDIINDNLIKLESDIEKEQNRLNVLQLEIEINNDETEQSNKEQDPNKKKEDVLDIKKEKLDKKSSEKLKSESSKSVHKDRPKSKDKSSKEKTNKEKELKKGEKSSKSHKSSEREKHRKEEKKNSSKDSESSKGKHISKERIKNRSRSPKEEKTDKNLRKNRNKSRSNSSSSDNSSEKHRKEKKSDSSKSKKHKTIEKSRSRSEKKEQKSKSRSTSREKSKHKKKRSHSHTRHKDDKKERKNRDKATKDGDKYKDRHTLKSSSSSTSKKTNWSSKKERRNKYTSESNCSISDNDNDNDQFPMDPEDLVPSDLDIDIDDEDETMRECYKIFSEYKPEPIKPKEQIEEVVKQDNTFEEDNIFKGKKRTAHAGAETTRTYSKLPAIPPPKATLLPGQILTNRYKIAKMAQANNEQENIMNEIKNITQQNMKRPATSLLEAARMHKMKRLQQQKSLEAAKPNANIVEDILNGVHKPSPSQVKIAPKKIAAVPNVALIQKAKERISLVKQRLQNVKTVAHTVKGGRVAHVPEYSLSDIPDVLQADKSKLPVNVRTRFLTMIVDECAKLYALKEDAYNRALSEEFACYEKCKVLATYRNSAMLAVNRLRKELQERESKGLGPLLSGESTVHKKETDFEGKRFYDHMRKWILTEDELNIHGYPRESGERGKAIINNRIEIDYSIVDDNYRKCSRCGKMYQVDDDGWPLLDEECMYHPLKKRTIRGEQVFLCCKSSDDTGCVTSDTHVFDGSQTHLLEGYQTTLPPESDDDTRSQQVYALDCEMCYTTKGLELTRVTIVDTECKTVYESFVKPLNPIIDYNTRFSGITKDQMDRTSTSILQVQANILHLCNSETILVGHSLESDMKALKIVHSTIIDTSVLFPHKMGLPHKKALRVLASEHLKKIIQNDVGGHDSAEDAVTCMDLIKWKLKEELKTRTK